MTNSQPHKHLFLDDASVERMDGLTRTMHQPEKRGPVLKPDIPSDGEMLWGAAPLWIPEEGVYKMFYNRYSRESGHRPALAVSTDGIHWEKPSLGLVEFEGSKANNHLPEAATHRLYDPDDPDPNRRYKGLLSGEYGCGRVPAVSPDGIHWRQFDAPNGHARVEALDEHARPLAGFAEADAAVVSGDRVRMPVRWKNGCGLDQMAGCRVRFRISLDQAQLYAFWTE